MKRVLAFILILLLTLQGTLAAFADTAAKDPAITNSTEQSADTDEVEPSADVWSCINLGIISEDDAFTAGYMNQEVTKLTAAIMLLKLRGLYEEAKAYNGSENFKDADKVSSDEEKNIMAYLRKNPQYGFAAEDESDNFNPSQVISEQYYYRVLLETLGYKEAKADSTGDFAWEDTLNFAKKAGLKPANVEKATIDNLAAAIVQTLKANTPDEWVYANKLVEAGAFTKEQVEQAGISSAGISLLRSAGNTLLKLSFDGAIDKKVVEDMSQYKIDGLEVKSARKMPNGRNVVILETSPQTSGQLYYMKYENTNFKFTGLPKASGSLALISVIEDSGESSTGEIIVKFDRMVDPASATDIKNYSFEGGTIESARIYPDKDDEVYFRVKGLSASKTIKAKISNIVALDGSVLKAAEDTFKLAAGSKKAQSVDSIDAGGNTRVMVTFDKIHNSKSALDIANYEIKSASGPLAIKEVINISSISIELVTEPQQAVEYELTVKNVADTKGNVMAKPYKKSFKGKMPTNSRPKITKVKIIERNLIEVTFSSRSRLNMESARNINNYKIDGDVAVYSANYPPKNENSLDFRIIQLKVSPLELNKRYTLIMGGIKDEYGNEIKETEVTARADKDAISAAGIKAVKSIVADGDKDVRQVEIEFDKNLDFLGAMDIEKVTIDGGIGHPVSSAYTIVDKKLLMALPAPLIAGKKYTVSINGMVDDAGNVLKIEKMPFYAVVADNDLNAPEITDVSAINKYVVSIGFDKPIVNIGDAKLELKKVDSNGNPTGAGIILTSKVGYDDDRRVEFSDYPNKALEDVEYMIVELSAKNVAGIRYELPLKIKEREVFPGTDEEPDGAEAESIDQRDSKNFELQFSEKVKATSVAFNGLTPSVNLDDNTVGYLKSAAKIKSDKVFKANLGNSFTNMHGIKVQNEDEESETEITADLDDSEAPYIESVEAVDTNTVKLIFNEGLEKPGAYEIKYENSKDKEVTISTKAAIDSVEDNKVLVTLDRDFLASEYEYALKVKSDPVDYAANKADIVGEEYIFEGTDMKAVANYITKCEAVSDTKIRISYYKALDTSKPITFNVRWSGSRQLANWIADKTPGREPYYESPTTIIINTIEPLVNGEWYYLYLAEAGWENVSMPAGFIQYTVPDELEVELSNDKYIFTYSGMTATDTVSAQVYGIKMVNGNYMLDQLKTLTITSISMESPSYELNSQNNLLLSAVVIDSNGSAVFSYGDSELKNTINYVKRTYQYRDNNSPNLASTEATAVNLIKAYAGLCKNDLMKLLNAAGSGLN